MIIEHRKGMGVKDWPSCNMRLPPETKKALEDKAYSLRCTLSELVHQYVLDGLARSEDENDESIA